MQAIGRIEGPSPDRSEERSGETNKGERVVRFIYSYYNFE